MLPGGLNIHTIGKIFSMSRAITVFNNDFGSYISLFEDGFRPFARAIKYTVGEELYRKTFDSPVAACVNVHKPATQIIDQELVHVGTSSFSVRCNWKGTPGTVNDETPNVASCDIMYAVVDSKSGKLAPLPAWYINRYKELTKMPRGDFSLKMHKPMDCFKHNSRVVPSDLDINNHVNQNRYSSFCLDAACVASSRGIYQGFDKEFLKHQVKRCLLLFTGGSRLDDVLTVNTWQNEADKKLIQFEIENGERIVLNCSMWF
ncbi:unnamed protein product [Owenia fusiformis]|uniref:Acyl-ACP thioesterase n=1 Tax=Owenia fusiformis TaxID=6347 RepID=A0A8S4MZZ2_OWEFU|nr:unnamed protein product [Owenia fusiformis]